MKVHILITGEPHVGIPHFETILDLGFELDTEEDRKFIRQCLTNCFSQIYNVEVGIQFDDERQCHLANERIRRLEEENAALIEES